MADKISGLGKPGTDARLSRTRSSEETGQHKQISPTTASPGGETDQVQLTEAATRLKNIEAKLSELDGIDHQRVTELRQRIEAGEYEIDSRQLAESLLALESKLHS